MQLEPVLVRVGESYALRDVAVVHRKQPWTFPREQLGHADLTHSDAPRLSDAVTKQLPQLFGVGDVVDDRAVGLVQVAVGGHTREESSDRPRVAFEDAQHGVRGDSHAQHRHGDEVVGHDPVRRIVTEDLEPGPRVGRYAVDIGEVLTQLTDAGIVVEPGQVSDRG